MDAGRTTLRLSVAALGVVSATRGGVDEAVFVFETNAGRFPESGNAHDSLGEAYLAAGEKSQAIASYRRSLELTPGNDNARQALERLEAEQ